MSDQTVNARPSTAMSVHFSSATDEWATPWDFFQRVSREFRGFDLDPCALPTSAKAARYYTPEDDGLSQAWTGRVWLNPPYGRTIGLWTARAVEAVTNGDAEVVVGLLPARTDTEWWHRDVMAQAAEVRLIRGRLRFGEATSSAPFPSALVVWCRSLKGPPALSVMTAKGLNGLSLVDPIEEAA